MTHPMTRHERVMRTLRFEDADRIPTYDILNNTGAIEHYAGETLTPINGDRVKGKAIGRGLDMTRYLKGPNAPHRMQDAEGTTWQIEPWTMWIIERPYHNLEELITWVRGRIERLNQWRPDAEFVARFHEDLRRHQAFFATGAEDPRDLPVIVIESPAGVDHTYTHCGLEMFSMLVCYEPDLVDEWIEAIHQHELRRVHAIADPRLFPVVLTHDDIASKNGPIFSPDWLRRYEIPRLKALVEAWHAHDTVCLFHSDGNLMPILDVLVGAGIDGLNPLETCAGMSVREVRARHPRLFLTGGIDVSQLMPHGSPEEVLARCREAIEEAGGTGYFLGSTTELHNAIPTANIVTMLEAPKRLADEKRLV